MGTGENSSFDRPFFWFVAIGIAVAIALWIAASREPTMPTCIEKYGAPAIHDPRTGEQVPADCRA
jgi:hypothetical protein